jgi:hypothetical protein
MNLTLFITVINLFFAEFITSFDDRIIIIRNVNEIATAKRNGESPYLEVALYEY